jgi:hypothetical protein
VQFAPGQRPNPFAVFSILRMDAATEPAIGINPQMFAGAIIATFGTGRTPGLDNAAGQLANFFQLGNVETHSPSAS